MDLLDNSLSKPLLQAHTCPISLDETDLLLSSLYDYHRHNGLGCIMLDEVLKSLRILFLAFFISYMSLCVNFGWWNKLNATNIDEKDILIPARICMKKVENIQLTVILVGTFCCFLRILFFLTKLPALFKIKKFFKDKLDINPNQLWLTNWERIQSRLINLSKSGEFSIDLDELKCHNIIMRHVNFIVGMINSHVLNFYPRLPIVGRFGCFTNLMEFYLFRLFFPSKFFYGSIFDSRVAVCELFQDPLRHHYIERTIRMKMYLMSILGLFLSPFLFVMQLLYIVFEYAEMIRSSPSSILRHKWSRFAHYALRNYSEYDHELEDRLNAAYPSANSYIKCFSSPMLNVVARHVTFFTGAFLILFFVLTLLRDSFLQVEGVVTLITVTTAIYAFGNNFESERQDSNSEKHMRSIVANIYHISYNYDKPRETYDNFKLCFQSHFCYLVEELLAPFSVPLMFMFYLRKKVGEIVHFVSDYTENMEIGDVCQFGLFDMKLSGRKICVGADEFYISDDKQNISLIAFSRKYGNWEPPEESRKYLRLIEQMSIKNMEMSRMMQKSKESDRTIVPPRDREDMTLSEDLRHVGVSSDLFGSIIYARMLRKHL